MTHIVDDHNVADRVVWVEAAGGIGDCTSQRHSGKVLYINWDKQIPIMSSMPMSLHTRVAKATSLIS